MTTPDPVRGGIKYWTVLGGAAALVAGGALVAAMLIARQLRGRR